MGEGGGGYFFSDYLITIFFLNASFYSLYLDIHVASMGCEYFYQGVGNALQLGRLVR